MHEAGGYMGLYWWRSNRVEVLAQAMAELFRAEPLASPFATEVILVPGMAMRRWLSLRLADSLGIRCQQQFFLPASWLWAQVSQHVEQPQATTLEAMCWRIFQLLPSCMDDPAFASVKRYLEDDEGDIRRWQLAERIADAFDRYQYYRPEWIHQWRDDAPDDDWQARLWQATQQGAMDRVAAMEHWLSALPEATLPTRLSVFCLPGLPPLLMRALSALAEHTDVHWFQLAPTAHYWADVSTAKAAARRRLRQSDADAVEEEMGHELLASWGRQGQAMQDMLLDLLPSAVMEQDCWHEDWPPTLLGQLQRSVFMLENSLPSSSVADDSIQLHICHSPMREVQVLHDQLLHMLNVQPELQPEDILVMVPDLESYGPCIAAVFDAVDDGPKLPWNLSDMMMQGGAPLLNVVFQLLALPQSRLTRSDMRLLLSQPELAGHFALADSEADELDELLDALGVRWGLDGEHRQALGLPCWQEQSWQAGEERWLAGLALGDTQSWQGIAPVPVGRDAADVLTRLSVLLDALRDWRQRLQAPRSMEAWQMTLLQLLSAFFDEDEAGQLQAVREALADMVSQADDTPLDGLLLRHILKRKLDECTMQHRYLTGGVNICGMRPMRAVPFRVIALLGMQDEDFPRRQHHSELDRMAAAGRPGDPHKGHEDRYLMLETLLSARQTLYISYTGRSIRDNSERQPSVLVRELLDFIDRERCISRDMIHEHPMQPFSLHNYRQPAPSFRRDWWQVAQRLQQPAGAAPAVAVSLPFEPVTPSWKDLQDFVAHPSRYFFRRRLGIYVERSQPVQDDECLSLDALQRWQLRQQVMLAATRNSPPDVLRLRADGRIPVDISGQALLQKEEATLTAQLASLVDYADISAQPRHVALSIGAYRVQGVITDYYPGKGLLHMTASELHGEHLGRLWVHHLALCASHGFAAGESSLLVGKKPAQLRLPPLEATTAMQYLQEIMDIWQQGSCRPLPVFPKTSWAWVNTEAGEKRQKAAAAAWYGSSWQGAPGGECDDDYALLCMRGIQQPPWQVDDFIRFSEGLYGPVAKVAAV